MAAPCRADGCRVGAPTVPSDRRRDAGRAIPAGLGCGPPRAAAQGRDAVAPLGGAPRRSSRRLRLQPVLRTLPPLGTAPLADHAPAPCRRRADVRRLRRHHARGDRPRDRRGPRGAALRRRARRLELHLRRGDLDAGALRLDRRALPGAVLFRRRARPDRLGQPQGRRHPRLLLRAGGEPHLRRHGRALRHRGGSGAAAQAARQGKGRGCGADRRALDHRAAEEPQVLLALGDQRGHPRAASTASTAASPGTSAPAAAPSSRSWSDRR